MSEKNNTEKIDETFQKIGEITEQTVSEQEKNESEESQDEEGQNPNPTENNLIDSSEEENLEYIPEEELEESEDQFAFLNVETEPQEVEHNTYPEANALNEDMEFLVGTGISGELASNVNDGYIELSLAAINAGTAILGPSDNGTFTVPEEFNDVSALFAVTVIDENLTTDILRDYNIELTLGYSGQTPTAKLKLNANLKWQAVNKPSYVLNDSFENNKTIQNVTRVKFMKLAGLLNSNYTGLTEFYELTAKHKGNGNIISVIIETVLPESSVNNELENLLNAEDRFNWDIIGRFLINKDYEGFYFGLKALGASNSNQVRILEILAERYENQTVTE